MTKLSNSKMRSNDGFEELVALYYDDVVCFISTIVKSDEVAADLAQDVFLRMWESKSRIKIKGSLNSYIYAAAKYKALNYLRSKRVERAYVECQMQIVSELLESHVLYDAKAVYHCVSRCVRAMPELRREVFVLSRRVGLTNPEIAERLGLSVKAIEYHISKAISELRVVVEPFRK